MPKITFIQSDGKTLEIDGSDGMILTQLPTMERVENIEGSCGGAMSCATCHVHVEEEWLGKLEVPSEDELNMLDFVDDLRPCSRLGCQIRMTPELDGLIVRVPPLAV